MKSRYEAVLFDLDGTLTQSHPGVIRCVGRALEKMGKPVPPPETLMKFIGPPLQLSFSKLGLTPEECRRGVDLFREEYNVRGVYENSVFDGMHDLLRDLRTAGAKIIIATSKSQEAAESVVNYFELAPLVDFVSGAYADERPHTKADLIRKGLAPFGIPPEKAVMIGDTHFDAEGAAGAGTDFIGVLFGYGTREEMEEQGGRKFTGTVDGLRPLLFEQ